jgi:competence ComEA-like helix-hairpin-helix protein
MPAVTMHSISSPPKNIDSEKDDRLIVLLGLGVLIIFIYCLQSFHCSFPTSRKHLNLHWDAKGLFVEEVQPSHLSYENDNPIQEDLIPAAISPFFFAPLPINEADEKLLETVSGIGPTTASEIVKARSLHGNFHNPEDLLKIRGIGKKRMLKFSDQFSFR